MGVKRDFQRDLHVSGPAFLVSDQVFREVKHVVYHQAGNASREINASILGPREGRE